jgi:ApbE superfamily uncharacterized protein (UPF0280 family)
MTRAPQIAWLADGKRLHLQDGPIDLIIEASGEDMQLHAAYQAAATRFAGLLDELCAELTMLRQPADPEHCLLQGVIARRMHDAVAPFARTQFITPMAAVAGAVAEEILGAMVAAAELDRAYVNNGGDIALHLMPGQEFSFGMMDRPDGQGVLRTAVVDFKNPSRGIATSGRHGRSFSLGIADAVTVLAASAAAADAAATIIGNAVDLPGHAAILRYAARDLQPDSDLGMRPVTREVGELSGAEIAEALQAGADCARNLLAAGLIDAATLRLQGETINVAPEQIGGTRREPRARRSDVKGAVHV